MADTSEKTVAVVLANGFEDSEYTDPVAALKDAGYRSVVIGTEADAELKGKKGTTVSVDKAVADAQADNYAALLVPGGHSPDTLRIDDDMVAFTKDFFRAGKPVAAICHGPQLLIEAEAVKGRAMTSWPSVRTDLINAGAQWQDSEVVVDGNLVTSRKPSDLPAFNRALLEQLD